MQNPWNSVASALLSLALPPVAFGAQVWVDSATLSPGSSGIIAVSFASEGNQVSGLQFDVVCDSSVLGLNVVPGTAMRSAGKAPYYADISLTQHRLLVAAPNQNLLSDGPVLTLFINVNPNATPGTYPVTIAAAAAVDAAGNLVPVSYASGVVTVAGRLGDMSAIQSAGLLNAASLLPGAVSPGELFAVMGSAIGPATPATLQVVPPNSVSTVLADTRVEFDGVAAPLIYAGLNQINAIVPYELSGRPTTQLTVSHSGQLTTPIVLPVTEATPAIFTQTASGTGQAAALNQDWSLNTPLAPAPVGSIIAVYLTGAGQMNPLQVTGRINGDSDVGTTVLTVTATIGGLPADVVYAGPAPALVAGAAQVNLRVPLALAPSLAVPLSIKVGNSLTQDDVVVSVGPAAPSK